MLAATYSGVKLAASSWAFLRLIEGISNVSSTRMGSIGFSRFLRSTAGALGLAEGSSALPGRDSGGDVEEVATTARLLSAE